MEATITKNGLVCSVDMKTIFYADDSGEFRGTVPNGVERIEDEAFACCNVEKVYIPDSVVYVGSNLFENSTALKSVRLPSGLKKLSPYMFAGCSALEQIEMPYEIESFEEGLFAGCTSLKEIPFRAGIKELPPYVFAGCSGIQSLILPNTIEKICVGAISNCSNLSALVLSSSLKIVEEGAFEDCQKLSHIRIAGENEFFRVDEDESCLYKKNSDGNEDLVLYLEGKSMSEVPAFLEIDESSKVSILDFNEEEDLVDDDSEVILSKEETSDISESVVSFEYEYSNGNDSINDIILESQRSNESEVVSADENSLVSDEIPNQVRNDGESVVIDDESVVIDGESVVADECDAGEATSESEVAPQDDMASRLNEIVYFNIHC